MLIPAEDPSFIDQTLIPANEPILSTCSDGPRSGRAYPVAETLLNGNERAYLNECIDTNWISSRGPFVGRFERAFAEACDTTHGVSCSSGNAALHLAIAAVGLGPGDEVIVPAFTMISTANAVRYTGATPKFVDAETEYAVIDSALIEQSITPATKAIVAVHIYGHPADMNAISAIAERHGLWVIEDAAEAHGARFDGRAVGSLGHISTFSFYANKIITCGEGGMVCTNDAALAGLVRTLRDHAFSPDRHFWHRYVGYNYRLTNLQAAVGLAQVERLQRIVAARRVLAASYGRYLKATPGLRLPAEAANVQSAFWMYGVRITEAFGMSRDALREALAQRGVETRAYFTPLHLQPVYFDGGASLPVAEDLSRSGLYLPTSEALTDDDARWISGQIIDIARVAGS